MICNSGILLTRKLKELVTGGDFSPTRRGVISPPLAKPQNIKPIQAEPQSSLLSGEITTCPDGEENSVSNVGNNVFLQNGEVAYFSIERGQTPYASLQRVRSPDPELKNGRLYASLPRSCKSVIRNGHGDHFQHTPRKAPSSPSLYTRSATVTFDEKKYVASSDIYAELPRKKKKPCTIVACSSPHHAHSPSRQFPYGAESIRQNIDLPNGEVQDLKNHEDNHLKVCSKQQPKYPSPAASRKFSTLEISKRKPEKSSKVTRRFYSLDRGWKALVSPKPKASTATNMNSKSPKQIFSSTVKMNECKPTLQCSYKTQLDAPVGSPITNCTDTSRCISPRQHQGCHEVGHQVPPTICSEIIQSMSEISEIASDLCSYPGYSYVSASECPQLSAQQNDKGYSDVSAVCSAECSAECSARKCGGTLGSEGQCYPGATLAPITPTATPITPGGNDAYPQCHTLPKANREVRLGHLSRNAIQADEVPLDSWEPFFRVLTQDDGALTTYGSEDMMVNPCSPRISRTNRQLGDSLLGDLPRMRLSGGSRASRRRWGYELSPPPTLVEEEDEDELCPAPHEDDDNQDDDDDDDDDNLSFTETRSLREDYLYHSQ
ncbi:unnamed protein product, partial [Meganyctiphanes norvegica]